MSDGTCPVCGGSPKSVESPPGEDIFEYDCALCGGFRISGFAATVLPARMVQYPGLKSALQRYVHRKNAAGNTPMLHELTIDEAESPTHLIFAPTLTSASGP